jgi:hypothetical protein
MRMKVSFKETVLVNYAFHMYDFKMIARSNDNSSPNFFALINFNFNFNFLCLIEFLTHRKMQGAYLKFAQ